MLTLSPTRDHKLLAALNEQVQNLHHQLHPERFKPYDRAAVEAAMETQLADPSCVAYVVWEHELPIGYAICLTKTTRETAFTYPVRSLYVDQICVLGTHRKSGAGSLLMQQAEKLAQDLGLQRIELDHWSTNAVAAAFFRRKGYSLYREMLYKQIQ
jgi:ribosomal protein S18 acetylase RimI-like enzyme